MAKQKGGDRFIKAWADRVAWKTRVKSVCKPCWEIKYCPYGPLVESFPLSDERTEKSCRIFGHDCPVFTVAEPFTETRELRRVSRSIHRATQFRVVRRDNHQCQLCQKLLTDEDVQFDHFIPWSTGGSSDESNLRVLCKSCNQERGNRLARDFLVDSYVDHVAEPHGPELLEFLQVAVDVGHLIARSKERQPTAHDYATELSNGELGRGEVIATTLYKDMREFFCESAPAELRQQLFVALRDRWGFGGSEFLTLREAAELHSIGSNDLLEAEIDLIQRLAWRLKLNAKDRRYWAVFDARRK